MHPVKLGPIWDKPFKVIQKVNRGAYSREDMFGKPLLTSQNDNDLKIYYKGFTQL